MKYLFIFLFLIFCILPIESHCYQDNLNRGIQEYRAENFEEAFDYFYKARQQNRDSSLIAFYLGLVYKQTGDYEKAIDYFQEAISLKPPVIEAFIEIIEMYYNIDKTKEALEYINKAEIQKIQPAKISFLKGLVLIKLNKNADAIKSFEKAKKEDITMSQPADFQIALAYAKDRKMGKAINSLRAVISTNPNSELGQFARDYEMAYLKSIESYKSTNMQTSLSFVYDTNVTAKPTSDIGLPASNEKDNALMGYFALNYNPYSDGELLFTAQYSASCTLYRRLSDYNSIAQTFLLSPGYSLEKGSLNFPLSYVHNLLGGKGYMATFSIKPTYIYILSPEQFLNTYIGLSYRNMLQQALDPDEERDSKLLNTGIGYSHAIAEGKGIFTVRYEYVIDNTKGKNWKNKGNKISAVLISPISEKTDMIISAEAFLQNYKNENTIFETKRSDKTYTFNAGLSRQIVPNLFANSQIALTNAQSNIALYEYKKLVFTIGLEYRF